MKFSNKMEFSVGDIVKIKDYNMDEIPNTLWVEDMYNICGKEARIVDVNFPKLFVDCEGRGWWIYMDDVEEIVQHNKDDDEKSQWFTKDDLKTGMVVECGNGERYLVMKEDRRYIDKDGYITADSFNDDLTDTSGDTYWDIQKVYQPMINGMENMFSDCNDSNMVWQRQIKKKMTKEEIEEALGYEIEIIG